MHEQDIRRATDRPGHADGPAAEAVIGRLAGSLPYVVGKKAASPDGVVVVLRVKGPVARELAVGVEGGRARFLDGVPGGATATLTMSTDAFVRRATGRADASGALEGGEATIEGDQGLGRAILEQLDVIP